jgi:CHASE2 domain-containing sensor protein
MLDWPFVLVTIAVVVLLGIVVGRLRREPNHLIALDVAGYAVFLIGIGWAMTLSYEALWPAFATSLGAILFTMAAERKKRVRQTA